MSAPVLGLITGFVFGFLLQKGRVLRFEKQVGALGMSPWIVIAIVWAIAIGLFALFGKKNL